MDIKDLPYILTAAYLIIISIIGFILPPVDKSKARKNKWRIRESGAWTAADKGKDALYRIRTRRLGRYVYFDEDISS